MECEVRNVGIIRAEPSSVEDVLTAQQLYLQVHDWKESFHVLAEEFKMDFSFEEHLWTSSPSMHKLLGQRKSDRSLQVAQPHDGPDLISDTDICTCFVNVLDDKTVLGLSRILLEARARSIIVFMKTIPDPAHERALVDLPLQWRRHGALYLSTDRKADIHPYVLHSERNKVIEQFQEVIFDLLKED